MLFMGGETGRFPSQVYMRIFLIRDDFIRNNLQNQYNVVLGPRQSRKEYPGRNGKRPSKHFFHINPLPCSRSLGPYEHSLRMIPTYKCLYFPHLIFQLLTRKSVTTVTELKTFGVLQIGAVSGDYRYFNGRVACVRVFNLALTEDEVEREMEDWKCPEKPGKSSRFQITRSKKTKGALFYTRSRLYRDLLGEVSYNSRNDVA